MSYTMLLIISCISEYLHENCDLYKHDVHTHKALEGSGIPALDIKLWILRLLNLNITCDLCNDD